MLSIGSSTQVFQGVEIFRQKQLPVYKLDAENPSLVAYYQTSCSFREACVSAVMFAESGFFSIFHM